MVSALLVGPCPLAGVMQCDGATIEIPHLGSRTIAVDAAPEGQTRSRAKTLGLDVPWFLQQRADEVIE